MIHTKKSSHLSLYNKHKACSNQKNEGRWGELSAVGEQEQKGIAERMLLRYPEIFVDSARIEAIASYIPRCISSMDAFLSGMEKQDSSLVIKKSAGKQYNPLLRFFDLNKPVSGSIAAIENKAMTNSRFSCSVSCPEVRKILFMTGVKTILSCTNDSYKEIQSPFSL